MIEAELADGRVLEFPDGTDPAVIQNTVRNMMGQQAPAQPAEPDFFDRVKVDLARRGENVSNIPTDEQTALENVLQFAGQGAGGIGDIIGQGLTSIGSTISDFTPDAIKEPIVDIAQDLGDDIVSSEVGQLGLRALGEGVEQYEEFRKEYPRAARNLEASVNVAILAAPVKGKPKAKPTIASRGGTKLQRAGITQAAKQRKDFVADLLQPKQTAAVRADQVGRTTESAGLLRSKTVQPTARELSSIDEVVKLDSVSPKKSLQGNFNAINKEIADEAVRLETALKQNEVFFPRKEYMARLRQARTGLKDNPLLVGDAEKTAEKIIRKMEAIVKDNPSNASGLLKSRKQLDNWIKSQKGTNIFDPKNENALSIALRDIRNTTNTFIDEKATGANVKNSLAKQASLFRASDAIRPKAADEATNRLSQAFQRVSSVVPLRSELSRTIALGGGGAAAGALMGSEAALLGGLLYGGAKAVKGARSAATKKALGSMLKATDRAIRKTKDNALRQQLKADRLLILSIINGDEDLPLEETTTPEDR